MSNRELSLANHLAHGGQIGSTIRFRCENCRNDLFEIVLFEEKKGTYSEDVIIERTYYLRCTRCGSEECDRVMSIIPSWSGLNIDREQGAEALLSQQGIEFLPIVRVSEL